MNLGYAISGRAESAGDYLKYCKADGIFRTALLSEPTFLTSSNALEAVFGSRAWKSLKWRDEQFGFSYSLDEDETKMMLREQVENLKMIRTERGNGSEMTNGIPRKR